MASSGTIKEVQQVEQGSMCVTYSSEDEATMAAFSLNGSCIGGSHRYIDVIVMDPMQFLAAHNIEMEKIQHFMALTPQQQTAVMSQGSLASARDPNAVLVRRMKQAKGIGKADGKGSFGPVGKGGCGNMSSPYGAGGAGAVPNMGGQQMNEMLLKMMELMVTNMANMQQQPQA